MGYSLLHPCSSRPSREFGTKLVDPVCLYLELLPQIATANQENGINLKCCTISIIQQYILQDRKLDHSAGSHGTPGIFFKYDFSPIKVYVEQKYKPFWKFLVRMCGIVGGIFACTGKFYKWNCLLC